MVLPSLELVVCWCPGGIALAHPDTRCAVDGARPLRRRRRFPVVILLILSNFCKTLNDSENPDRSCATQRFRCNQVFRGTATGDPPVMGNIAPAVARRQHTIQAVCELARVSSSKRFGPHGGLIFSADLVAICRRHRLIALSPQPRVTNARVHASIGFQPRCADLRTCTVVGGGFEVDDRRVLSWKCNTYQRGNENPGHGCEKQGVQSRKYLCRILTGRDNERHGVLRITDVAPAARRAVIHQGHLGRATCQSHCVPRSLARTGDRVPRPGPHIDIHTRKPRRVISGVRNQRPSPPCRLHVAHSLERRPGIQPVVGKCKAIYTRE